jgi:hypothetical protein
MLANPLLRCRIEGLTIELCRCDEQNDLQLGEIPHFADHALNEGAWQDADFGWCCTMWR